MFPGSIVPQAFTELIRVVKKGGVIAWNIADGYEVGAKCQKKTYNGRNTAQIYNTERAIKR